MKSKCLFLKKVLLIGCIIFQLGQSLKAQTDEWPTLMEINDIGYYHIDSSQTYVFYPICKDSFCTDLQLQMYGYVWDFGKGRYSLEAMPRMQFEDNEEVEIKLRLTGFKTIKDPDAKRPQKRAALNNCQVTDTLLGFWKVKAAKMEDRFPNPKVTILQPSHIPVPGKCVDYLIRFDIPKQCRLSGRFELAGGIKSWPKGGGWEINDFECSEELTVEKSSRDKLSITINKNKRSKSHPRTLYLLVHGKFSDSARLEDMFHLDITGKFTAADPNGKCMSTAISEIHESKFTGSLDPPHLACGAPSQVKHGDRILWDIKVQNLGNAAESDIEITDTLPTSLDWDRIELHSALWNGKDIEVIAEHDTANHILKWRLNNDEEPLPPGAYAQIQFYSYVNQDFPCPELPGASASPCLDRGFAGRPIVHWVWTKFHGEQVAGGLKAIQHGLTNQETVVLCREACRPDVTPVNREATPSNTMQLALMGFAAALLVGVAIFIFYRSRRKA